MKMLRSIMVALVLGVSASAAQAHDSFHIGISLGGHGVYGAPVVGYPAVAYPPVAYRVAPQVIYYDAPSVYHPAPHVYYRAPAVGYRDVFYGAPRPHFSVHRHHHRHGHRGHFR